MLSEASGGGLGDPLGGWGGYSEEPLVLRAGSTVVLQDQQFQEETQGMRLGGLGSYPHGSTVRVAEGVMPGLLVPPESWFHSWRNWRGEEWVEWTREKAPLGSSVEVTMWVLSSLWARLPHGAWGTPKVGVALAKGGVQDGCGCAGGEVGSGVGPGQVSGWWWCWGGSPLHSL